MLSRPLLPRIIGGAATSAARRMTLTVQCAAASYFPGPHRIDHEQAKRAVALLNDPVTTRLQKLVKDWEQQLGEAE
jgi:hypothetical protein